MDEQTIKAINEAAERFNAALLKAFEPIKEWAKKSNASLAEIADAISEIYDAFFVQKSIEKIENERSKWRRMAPPKIRPLLLDKRSKTHRCRNAI